MKKDSPIQFGFQSLLVQDRSFPTAPPAQGPTLSGLQRWENTVPNVCQSVSGHVSAVGIDPGPGSPETVLPVAPWGESLTYSPVQLLFLF